MLIGKAEFKYVPFQVSPRLWYALKSKYIDACLLPSESVCALSKTVHQKIYRKICPMFIKLLVVCPHGNLGGSQAMKCSLSWP